MAEENININEDNDELSVSINMIVPVGISDTLIEKHYETGRLRVVQERNDIFLTHVLSFISKDSKNKIWSNIRPEYQRRLRWDNRKKSQLIESFIMNIPVPPIFLYEKTLGNFEVMDGQQRLNAISSFYEGEFPLQGLKIWQALNGKTYSQLPPLIRRGLDRAKISAITLMSDNSTSIEDSIDLRAQVFDRLNTGGEKLNAQELRNALYAGPFNELMIELSRDKVFSQAWEIPAYEENLRADGSVSELLEKNTLYKRMSDVEIVIRFFAFNNPEVISGSVRNMLDETLKRNRHCSEIELDEYRKGFNACIRLCLDVYKEDAFRLPKPNSKSRSDSILSRPLFDAQMIGMYLNINHKDKILAKALEIKDRMSLLTRPGGENYDLMVGRANTSSSIKERIYAVANMVNEVIND
ncbi:DUF262 domain-containing protein [Serratia fonticola]|uniref:GmrSD restriction endonuclease domain-containing protein n=1 Tax=Serratia fonticola TaxID=47917 RepID=UPI001577718F|nr:DUF262 domain-containing protein [Serratia fonticola]NTY86502.1 DUF262 domain-containing protein [Serratia fonticola]NTZ12387.1 DUF262 domain-containing protein [Serratia fonticola]